MSDDEEVDVVVVGGCTCRSAAGFPGARGGVCAGPADGRIDDVPLAREDGRELNFDFHDFRNEPRTSGKWMGGIGEAWWPSLLFLGVSGTSALSLLPLFEGSGWLVLSAGRGSWQDGFSFCRCCPDASLARETRG